MKIAVVTDSGSGLTQKEANEKGLYFLPLQIVGDNATYLDGVDIDVKTIFTMMRKGESLKTSLPPLGMVEEMFTQMKVDGYEHILCVSLTAGLSSTMQSILIAAEESSMPITCIECYSTCYIQQYLALSAKRLVDEGVPLDDIIARLQESVKHSNTLIVPDDLQHLKRGGRLTPVAAALGGMLKIKPILQLNEGTQGKVDTFAKVRTMSKALQSAVDSMSTEGINEDYILVVLHADDAQGAQQLKELYFSAYPHGESVFGFIGPVISVHTGIGCLGMQYIKKV